MRRAIEAALRMAGVDPPLQSTRDLSGGCIDHVVQIELASGAALVAKLGRADAKGLFDEEAVSLEALAATDTVRVPTPMGVYDCDGTHVLLMSFLSPGQADNAAWARFGAELAALHMAPEGERFGFRVDNHIGSTSQPNAWSDDWVEFNRQHRFGHQLRLLRQSDLVREEESRAIETVIERLADFIPHHPRPALLHGDLWSGNALATSIDGAAAIGVIDPACSIGDGWADIAMMRLFGGFPGSCLDEYARRQPDQDGVESRLAVYELYHLVNHVNIFGRGYMGQAMSTVRKLLSE